MPNVMLGPHMPFQAVGSNLHATLLGHRSPPHRRPQAILRILSHRHLGRFPISSLQILRHFCLRLAHVAHLAHCLAFSLSNLASLALQPDILIAEEDIYSSGDIMTVVSGLSLSSTYCFSPKLELN